MVLTGRHGHHVPAIDHHYKAGLLAHQTLFNHHACTTTVVGHTKAISTQHVVHSSMCLPQRGRYHHALACGQTIGFDHNWCTHLVNVGVCQRGVCKGFKRSGRYGVTLHESFGESFGALQLRSRLRGAEHMQTLVAKQVHQTVGQWGLWANNREVDGIVPRPSTQLDLVCDVQVDKFAVYSCTAITGCDIHV